MARGLKSAGMEELRALKRRTMRQYSMGRITKPDRDKIIGHIDAIEAHIVYMPEEIDEYEREV